MKIVYQRGPYRMRFWDKVSCVWWVFLCLLCAASVLQAETNTSRIINGLCSLIDLYFALDSVKFYEDERERERIIVPIETEEDEI